METLIEFGMYLGMILILAFLCNEGDKFIRKNKQDNSSEME
jgi:hypothetical protein